MRPKYRFPVRVEDSTIQLFGHLSWRDVARLLIPVVVAAGVVKLTGSSYVVAGVVLPITGLVGVAWWRIRIAGLPVEVFLYRGAEYQLRNHSTTDWSFPEVIQND